MSRLRIIVLLPLIALLSGCNLVVLHPSGDIAAQQRDLLLQSTGLMLIIILPVMFLTVFFAWRYRQSNRSARYEPKWDHSTQLELVIWGAPLLIIICLGALTWMGTHLLDPYRPLDRIAEGRPVNPDVKPLEVDVVALDWKWLFIYPQYGVATLNQLAAPVDRPIDFKITATSVMNSFYIPALAGQIYAMPGMETSLHAVMNKPGVFGGISANYSGAGFSGMHFTFSSLSDADFDKWIATAKAGSGTMARADFLELERPTENEPPRSYAKVDADLFSAIVNRCVEAGKMCQNEMTQIDARGGLGVRGLTNLFPVQYDKFARRGSAFGPEPSFVASICSADDPVGAKGEARSAGISVPLPGPRAARVTPPMAQPLSRAPSNS